LATCCSQHTVLAHFILTLFSSISAFSLTARARMTHVPPDFPLFQNLIVTQLLNNS
jgi:hypothetical protein